MNGTRYAIDTSYPAPRRTDFVGRRFGMLTVTGFVGRRIYAHNYINVWRCVCDCGIECDRVQRALLDDGKSSCGCAYNTGRPGYGRGSFNALFAAYKRGARDRGYSFELSSDQFHYLTSSDCYYCGEHPRQRLTNGRCAAYVYNGVDRINNALGYTTDNTRPCCGVCNSAKRTMSEAEFLGWVARVHERCNRVQWRAPQATQ